MNNKTPEHIAIIMDGNGRWANSRGLPRAAGHRAGVKTVREIVKASAELGVPILTLYAFSQENWKRPKEEVAILMELLEYFLSREIEALRKEGVRLKFIGHLEALPPHILNELHKAVESTKNNKKLILNIALNYGARTEILDAVERIVEKARRGELEMGPDGRITEEIFSNYLYTQGLPDPDLLIRTSGEMRLSNFLLWQLSYAEIYITKKFWPDFTRDDFLRAVHEYQRRERRFGDVQPVLVSGQ
ncbi:MAG: isoprenyl transferase [Candidatus Omnitrophica bacterium]|nr:isoprenyl transferase [Candidatus Omnitrophota bacterium]